MEIYGCGCVEVVCHTFLWNQRFRFVVVSCVLISLSFGFVCCVFFNIPFCCKFLLFHCEPFILYMCVPYQSFSCCISLCCSLGNVFGCSTRSVAALEIVPANSFLRPIREGAVWADAMAVAGIFTAAVRYLLLV